MVPVGRRWGGRACWCRPSTAARGPGCWRPRSCARRWAPCRCPGRGCPRRWPAPWPPCAWGTPACSPTWRPAPAGPPWRVEETGARDPLDAIATTARREGDGWRLDGLKPLVIDGDTADVAYVVAREPDGGLAGFAVEDPAAEPVPGLDVTRTLARLALAGRPARRVGPAGRPARPVGPHRRRHRHRPVRRERGRRRPRRGHGLRLRPPAGPVRPPDRHLPGDPAQDRGHAPPAGAGPGGHPLRRLGQRGGRPAAGGGHGHRQGGRGRGHHP